MEMPSYIERMVNEKSDLDNLIQRLTAFIEAPVFRELNETHKYLLRMQLSHMQAYSDILKYRIELSLDEFNRGD